MLDNSSSSEALINSTENSGGINRKKRRPAGTPGNYIISQILKLV